ncbi:phosphonopyruvate decarboxylase [Pseudooceanicola sp.]|uniref:phosphonopyruvate decarboxylase n=1 Tax=Pseudooceanicola sp. TaxID=1914328 RepID=UPI002636A08B|nr:phosphonopyruvate decarboxylase [Pseudooceanicola sp.]MDF1854408.1 phosphonopyruvate decarboxylase [Pseudooceanicola sp.]
MLNTSNFLEDLAALGLRDFFGVPDSLLSPFISGIELRAEQGLARLEITANEGGAVGLAIGAHLASGAVSAVFMQNSGLGNAVNPLASLASPKVYGTPMLLIIGWRGEMRDGVQLKDEPQHVLQGEITLGQLDLLDTPYAIIHPEMGRASAQAAAARMIELARAENKPAALVVRKDSFSKVAGPAKATDNKMTREAAIAAALGALPDGPSIVGTTGKISREIYELRQSLGIEIAAFLSVGGMGHASAIAAGIAMQAPERPVVCFDGDGATLMQAGNLATAAKQANLLHLVFNNQVHDSVGGQPTAAPDLRLCDLAGAMGYQFTDRITEIDAIAPAINAALATDHACFLEIMVAPGARSDLGRPRETPGQSKVAFMRATGALND